VAKHARLAMKLAEAPASTKAEILKGTDAQNLFLKAAKAIWVITGDNMLYI